MLGQVGSVLATLAISVHKTPPPAGVYSLRDWMDGTLRLSGGMIPKHIATGKRKCASDAEGASGTDDGNDTDKDGEADNDSDSAGAGAAGRETRTKTRDSDSNSACGNEGGNDNATCVNGEDHGDRNGENEQHRPGERLP